MLGRLPSLKAGAEGRQKRLEYDLKEYRPNLGASDPFQGLGILRKREIRLKPVSFRRRKDRARDAEPSKVRLRGRPPKTPVGNASSCTSDNCQILRANKTKRIKTRTTDSLRPPSSCRSQAQRGELGAQSVCLSCEQSRPFGVWPHVALRCGTHQGWFRG